MLAKDNAERGLWRATNAAAMAGRAHVILIGISAYPHLPGGTGPIASNAIGMRQLVASAATAAQLFDWIQKNGEIAGQPVATCRLLLAPGPTLGDDGVSEHAFVQTLSDGWYAPPSYANIEMAIRAWADEFFRTPKAQQKQTAGVFFFSGHGLEVAGSPSILAADVLNPNSGMGAGNAIAYNNISEMLPTYGVGDLIFFFDSCRVRPDLAQRMNIQGRRVLDASIKDVHAPTSNMKLKAAEFDALAYSDPKSKARASIFGQALLEALQGQPPRFEPYETGQDPWRLPFQKLEKFTKQRVSELLKAANSLREQTVVPAGDPYVSDLMVARRPGAPQSSGGEWMSGGGDEGAVLKTALASHDDAIDRAFLGTPTSAPIAGTSKLSDPGSMHGVFDHEWITGPWASSLQVRSALSGYPAPESAVQSVSGRTSVDARVAWIDIMLAPSPGEYFWISTAGHPDFGAGRMGVLVPLDSQPIPLRLKYRFDDKGLPLSLSAQIGPVNAQTSPAWNALWEFTRTCRIASTTEGASRLPDMSQSLTTALASGQTTLLSATLAASLLLQLGAEDYVERWVKELVQQSTDSPDAAYMAAELAVRRSTDRRSYTAHADVFDLPLPRLAPVYSLLAQAVERISLQDAIEPRQRAWKKDFDAIGARVTTDTAFMSLRLLAGEERLLTLLGTQARVVSTIVPSDPLPKGAGPT